MHVYIHTKFSNVYTYVYQHGPSYACVHVHMYVNWTDGYTRLLSYY